METVLLSPTKRKVFQFGKIAYSDNRKINAVQVEVELKYEPEATNWETMETMHNIPRFTASGGIWNGQHTDYVSCGQNLDELNKEIKDPVLSRIHKIWAEYHLNDLQAGTKAQTEALDNLKKSGWVYEYPNACNYLKSIGLYTDRGYKYGHGWLYKPIPKDILSQINSLLSE